MWGVLGFFFVVVYNECRFQIFQCLVFLKQGDGLKFSPSKNGIFARLHPRLDSP